MSLSKAQDKIIVPEANAPNCGQRLEKDFRRSYAYSRPRRLGGGSRPAVLVVDFILGFTSPDSELAGVWDREIAAAAELLAVSHERGHPSVVTTVQTGPGSPNWILARKAPRVKRLQENACWAQPDPRLGICPKDWILPKPAASAFFGTPLAEWLSQHGVDTVLVSGCVTSGCVRATVVDAAQYGFQPLVVREAVGDRNHLAHLANLMDIEQRYGDVVALAEAKRYLDRGMKVSITPGPGESP